MRIEYLEAYIFFAIIFLLGGAYMVLQHRVVQALKVRHPKEWEAVGQPATFVIKDVRTLGRFWKYLFSGRHKELGDPDLSKNTLRLRYVSAVYIFLFGSIFAAVFVGVLIAVAIKVS